MPITKPTHSITPAALTLYEKLGATVRNRERKGATVPYTSVNGHMFSYLAADGTLALRLPQQAREVFLKQYKTTLVVAYGTVMKEYVAVPGSLQKKTKELQKYFALCFDYVNGLTPKATKKAKTAKR